MTRQTNKQIERQSNKQCQNKQTTSNKRVKSDLGEETLYTMHSLMELLDKVQSLLNGLELFLRLHLRRDWKPPAESMQPSICMLRVIGVLQSC